LTWLGAAGQARHDSEWHGKASIGLAGKAWTGMVRRSKAGLGRQGELRQNKTWRGAVWIGRQGMTRRGALRRRKARQA
jgi:hypothetical protein